MFWPLSSGTFGSIGLSISAIVTPLPVEILWFSTSFSAVYHHAFSPIPESAADAGEPAQPRHQAARQDRGAEPTPHTPHDHQIPSTTGRTAPERDPHKGATRDTR